MTSKTVDFSVANASQIKGLFDTSLKSLSAKSVDGQLYHDLLLMLTEAVANAIKHADEIKKRGHVDCRISLSSQSISLLIDDHGRGFKPDRIPIPNFKSLKKNGRGVFIMRQLADSVSYRKGKTKNTLVIKRNLSHPDSVLKELDLLHDISQAILEPGNKKGIYEAILDKTVRSFQVERASILLYNKESKKLSLVASIGLSKKDVALSPGEGIAGFVFRHAKPCLIEDMDKNVSGWKKKKRYKSRSFISAPLMAGPLSGKREAVGVINMTDRKNGRPFTRKDLKLLTTIANQATAYLHIGELLGKARAGELLRRDVEVARRVQESFLPDSPPLMPGLECLSWCETAQSVGGDYHDYAVISPTQAYVMVGDVSGHDISAAMSMVNLRSRIRALIDHESDPGFLLERVGKSICEDLQRVEQFASLVVAQINVSSGVVNVANAGHPAPVLVKQGKILSLGGVMDHGLVLGVSASETYRTFEMTLGFGETLVFFSDGIVECLGKKNRRYTQDEFFKSILQHSQKSLSQMMDGLQKDLLRHLGAHSWNDDVTLLLVRRQQST